MKTSMDAIKKMSTASIKSKLESGKLSDEQKQCAIEVLRLRGIEWKEEMKEESTDLVEMITKILDKEDPTLTKKLTSILGDKEYKDDYSDLELEKVEKIKKLLNEEPKKESKEKKEEKQPKEKKEKTPKEKKEKAPREKKERVPKDAPKEGSKSMKIYEALVAGSGKSMYAIAKELGCRYSEVVRVKKLYNL